MSSGAQPLLGINAQMLVLGRKPRAGVLSSQESFCKICQLQFARNSTKELETMSPRLLHRISSPLQLGIEPTVLLGDVSMWRNTTFLPHIPSVKSRCHSSDLQKSEGNVQSKKAHHIEPDSLVAASADDETGHCLTQPATPTLPSTISQ